MPDVFPGTEASIVNQKNVSKVHILVGKNEWALVDVKNREDSQYT